MVNNRESTAVRWVSAGSTFLPLPPFLLEHRQLAGEQTPSETVSPQTYHVTIYYWTCETFIAIYLMYNSSFPRECIIHPGQEEKDGTFPDENPLPTTPNVYILLTLNSCYEIGIDLWTISESRLRFDSFFIFSSFLAVNRFTSNAIILEWWPPCLSVPRIISRRRIPLSFSIYLKEIPLSRMIQPAANYQNSSSTFPGSGKTLLKTDCCALAPALGEFIHNRRETLRGQLPAGTAIVTGVV